MKFLQFAVLAATAAFPASAQAEAKSDPISRYTKLSQCKEVEHPPPGEDWVYFRCKGIGQTYVWYVCTDSARCRYGFGTRPNVSGLSGTNRRDTWQIEWRGTHQQGRFKPFAIIIRMSSPDHDQLANSTLAVYRLRADGTSCIVGEASSNDDARKMADSVAGAFRCVAEPDLL